MGNDVSHSVPVLDESIPTTGHHLGCFVRMPQAADAHCVMRLELAVGQQARNKVSSSNRTEHKACPFSKIEPFVFVYFFGVKGGVAREGNVG